MADVNSIQESDWGPWQTEMPPVGHPFILHLDPESPVPKADVDGNGSNGGRYRITKVTKNDNYLEMEKWYRGKWYSGHTWEMSNKPRFRMLVQNATVSATVDKYAGEGCVCTKCNDRNRWAEPNQPNGTYICFACPKPRR